MGNPGRDSNLVANDLVEFQYGAANSINRLKSWLPGVDSNSAVFAARWQAIDRTGQDDPFADLSRISYNEGDEE